MIFGPSVSESEWAGATGWHLDDTGWCSGDRCVPVSGLARTPDGRFDTESIASACGRAAFRRGDLVAVGPEVSAGVGATGSIAAGAPLPDLSLVDRNGNQVTLASLVGRRRRMVLHAWAPW
jgi:hypothetical protein